MAYTGIPEFSDSVSASDVATEVQFGFMARRVTIINDGSSTIYFSLSGSPATTSSFPLKSGESWGLTGLPTIRVGGLSVICAAGQTATVRVGAWE